MQNFLEAVEKGYSKYKNPYHNLVHAADVLQTLYNILNNAGLLVIFLNSFSTIKVKQRLSSVKISELAFKYRNICSLYISYCT